LHPLNSIMRLLIVIFLFTTSRHLYAQETAPFYFNKGFNYLIVDKQESINYFSQSIAKDPNFSLAYYYRGLANYKLGKYEHAISDFEKALATDENMTKCYIYIGFAQQQLNNNTKALASFESYLQNQKQISSSDHLVLAKSKAANGDDEGALIEYQLALDETTSEEQLYHLFLAMYDENNFLEASKLINQIIQINPSFYGYYLHKGKVELNAKKYDSALKNFNFALGLNPDVADTYFMKANTLDTLQRLDEALINYSSAIQLNPTDGSYYSKRGNTKMALGNRNGACLDWTIAGELGYYADFDKIKTVCEKTIIKNK